MLVKDISLHPSGHFVGVKCHFGGSGRGWVLERSRLSHMPNTLTISKFPRKSFVEWGWVFILITGMRRNSNCWSTYFCFVQLLD